MNDIPLLIMADEDEQYLFRIRNYAKHQHQLQAVPIEYFSDIQKLEAFIQTVDRTIVLLICDKLSFATFNSEKITKKILLVDQKTRRDTDEVILKIQPLPSLVEQLIERLDGVYSFEQTTNERRTCQITTVYSPVGGVGKTLVASKLANHLSGLGLRTLYLNLESFQSFSNDERVHSPVFSTLIYYLHHYSLEAVPKELLDEMQKQLTKNSTFQQFDTVLQATDLDYLDKQSLYSLFELLQRKMLFDQIIIDLDSAMCKRTIASLELAHIKLIITDHHHFSRNKVAKWKSDFKDLWCEQSFIIMNKCLDEPGLLNGYKEVTDASFQLPYIPKWKPDLNPAETATSDVFDQNIQWLCQQLYGKGG